MSFDPSTAILDEENNQPIGKGVFDPSTAVLDEGQDFMPTNKITPTKKDIIDTLSGTTPKELAESGHWVAGGLQQTTKDIFTIPAHFLNQFLLNAPRSIAYKMGYQYPEAESKVGKIASKTAGVVGGFSSPIFKLLRFRNGMPLTETAIKGAIIGGAYTPTENIVGLKERTINTTLGAITPLALKGGENLIVRLPQAKNVFAGRLINSLIKPLGKDFAYGKNPGLAVAQEKIVANNMDELAEKIIQRKEEIGEKIGEVLGKSEKMVNMKGILSPLDTGLTIARKAPNTNAGLISRLEGIREDLRGIFGGKDLQMATPKLANEMKKQIGQLTKFTGNPSDDKLANKSLKIVYGKLRVRIEETVPEVKGLNERWGNLESARIATEYRDQVLQRQNMIGLAPRLAGYGSLVASLVTGNPKLVLDGIAIIGAEKIANSPMLKTRLAAGLAKMPTAQRISILQKYPVIEEALFKGSISLPGRITDNLSKNGRK